MKYKCTFFLIEFILILQLCMVTFAQEREAFKVGVVLGLTGPANTWGQASLEGLKLAEHEINSKIDKDSRKIKLLVEDSQTNPTSGITAFNKLVNVDKVAVVIGDVWGHLTNAVVPISARSKVLYASPTVFKESIELKHDYFFSMGENTESLLPALNLFYKRNPQIKKIGIFCWDDPWGLSYHRVWKQAAINNNIEIALEICSLDFNSDFKIDVTKMKSKAVDAVFITYKTGLILKRMKEQKMNPIVLSTSDMLEDLISPGYPKNLFEGVYLTDWLPSNDFVNKFEGFHGHKPINQAHNSYELLNSLYKAYQANPDDINSSLKQVEYQGVAGKIDFTKDNWGNQDQAELYRVNQGQVQLQ